LRIGAYRRDEYGVQLKGRNAEKEQLMLQPKPGAATEAVTYSPDEGVVVTARISDKRS
jgi:hypothetical protein